MTYRDSSPLITAAKEALTLVRATRGRCRGYASRGRVLAVTPTFVDVALLGARIGDLCLVDGTTTWGQSYLGEVIHTSRGKARLAMCVPDHRVVVGAGVRTLSSEVIQCTGPLPSLQEIITRVEEGRAIALNAFGAYFNNVDSGLASNFNQSTTRDVMYPVPLCLPPLARGAAAATAISEPLVTGIRTIDAFTPLGHGQRVGIFARAGLGKTTLLRQIINNCEVDLVVVALVGERGREVAEFLPSISHRPAITVVATSDEPPTVQMRAAMFATSLARRCSERGKKALLIVDSLTRIARAYRSVALERGEQLLSGSTTSSTLATLAALVEQCGARRDGTCTGIYTILTEATEFSPDPLADEVRSLLDGHLILNDATLSLGVRPSIDIRESLSRVAPAVASPEYLDAANSIRIAFSRWCEERYLASLSTRQDESFAAIAALVPRLINFLNQPSDSRSDWPNTRGQLLALGRAFTEARKTKTPRPSSVTTMSSR